MHIPFDKLLLCVCVFCALCPLPAQSGWGAVVWGAVKASAIKAAKLTLFGAVTGATGERIDALIDSTEEQDRPKEVTVKVNQTVPIINVVVNQTLPLPVPSKSTENSNLFLGLVILASTITTAFLLLLLNELLKAIRRKNSPKAPEPTFTFSELRRMMDKADEETGQGTNN